MSICFIISGLLIAIGLVFLFSGYRLILAAERKVVSRPLSDVESALFKRRTDRAVRIGNVGLAFLFAGILFILPTWVSYVVLAFALSLLCMWFFKHHPHGDESAK